MRAADPRLTLAAVSLVQFLVSLDLLVVNVALPRIGDALAFDDVGLGWVIHAYALTFGGLLLLGGKAADRYGRRRVLVGGLVVFGVASLLGGFALASAHLVVARAVQGIGAAALQPASLAVLSTTFPSGRARARAFGVWSAMNALGAALGVLIGGVLTEYAGWRWVMFINIPLVAVALILTWRGMAPDARGAVRGGFDVPGAVLATGGMSLLVYGIVSTDDHPWTSLPTLLTFAAAVAMLCAFFAVERRTAGDPLLRPGLLRHRTVAGANAGNLLIGAAMASVLYFMSLYVQNVLGQNPAVTGLMFLPFALGIVVGSFLAIRLGARFSRRALIVGGCALTAVGFSWFGFISPDGGFLTDILGPSVIASVGFGICLGPIISIGTVGVAPDEAGTASSLLSSTRQLGATLGLAALSAVAHTATGTATSASAVTAGYGLAMLAAAGLIAVTALIGLIALPHESADPGRAGDSTTEAARVD
ncbi:MFS transporter [Nocardiopsis composta]|uniref:EmrB/QacA subfamily drug resistance transporter n=1 Tax=Nocardiopsis composta TaxID=157465 RepID=A0A7W8VFJ7_9ACTN|nr:MFS transporter [Nocardiopsis composta]MBB5434049.1 EmrB/QacA subfamily drug resistance transporter [Nocardiopsis composta]